MGCKLSKTEEDKMNDAINQSLRDDRKKLDKEIKMLLLGTGESGKSTIAKQLKILHMDGFSGDELASYRPVISNNVLSAFRNIMFATEKFGKMQELTANTHTNSDTALLKEAAEFFMTVDPLKDETSPMIARYIKELWKSPVIQYTLSMYSQFQLPDSTFYLVENIDRITKPDYMPTSEDVLRCRARTTGIVEIEFEIEQFKFRVLDVGGQRSERKKWIHCFEGVTALIFCVALNEYDQKLYEDERVNRMHEAVELFEEICNSEWFLRTDIILFLNKSDLFKEKITRVDLNVCFPEYNGGLDFDNAATFIKEKFLSLNRTQNGKQIYSHITCATDTENVRVVFNATKNIFLNHNLEGAGFT